MKNNSLSEQLKNFNHVWSKKQKLDYLSIVFHEVPDDTRTKIILGQTTKYQTHCITYTCHNSRTYPLTSLIVYKKRQQDKLTEMTASIPYRDHIILLIMDATHNYNTTFKHRLCFVCKYFISLDIAQLFFLSSTCFFIAKTKPVYTLTLEQYYDIHPKGRYLHLSTSFFCMLVKTNRLTIRCQFLSKQCPKQG